MTEHEERELNKRIAKALGYTFEDVGELCTVTSPDGTWRRGYHPDQYTSVPGLGNWVRDTDAALALAIQQGCSVNLFRREKLCCILIGPETGGSGNGDTYSEAVCRAWLDYKKNKHPRK